jgi:hypothetical protein
VIGAVALRRAFPIVHLDKILNLKIVIEAVDHTPSEPP